MAFWGIGWWRGHASRHSPDTGCQGVVMLWLQPEPAPALLHDPKTAPTILEVQVLSSEEVDVCMGVPSQHVANWEACLPKTLPELPAVIRDQSLGCSSQHRIVSADRFSHLTSFLTHVIRRPVLQPPCPDQASADPALTPSPWASSLETCAKSYGGHPMARRGTHRDSDTIYIFTLIILCLTWSIF